MQNLRTLKDWNHLFITMAKYRTRGSPNNQFSSSSSSSRSNCDVTSFRSDMGTYGRTDGPTDRPTDGPTDRPTDREVSYRGATLRLKTVNDVNLK
jgi:hypothetical protein